MTALPEELMREARTIAQAIERECLTAEGTYFKADAANLIATALRARDERAARIARQRIVGGHMHGSPEWSDGEAIATAILTYDEATR